MFYVYLLQNNDDQIYIGYTADLEKRLKEHNYGKVESTKRLRPWRIVYYEAYLSRLDAQIRERTLKNYGSTLGQLKKRIGNSLSA
jgi:putative endonuclease